jgi:hypothetical protein
VLKRRQSSTSLVDGRSIKLTSLFYLSKRASFLITSTSSLITAT